MLYTFVKPTDLDPMLLGALFHATDIHFLPKDWQVAIYSVPMLPKKWVRRVR